MFCCFRKKKVLHEEDNRRKSICMNVSIPEYESESSLSPRSSYQIQSMIKNDFVEKSNK